MCFSSTLENVEFSRRGGRKWDAQPRGGLDPPKGPLVDETSFWQFSHKGHTRKLLCWSRPPFQPGPPSKVGCATPGGAGHSSGLMFFLLPSKTSSFLVMCFSSTLENVEFSRRGGRKWDAQPRGGLDTCKRDVFFFYPRKRRVFS